jgi:hypothetical protein
MRVIRIAVPVLAVAIAAVCLAVPDRREARERRKPGSPTAAAKSSPTTAPTTTAKKDTLSFTQKPTIKSVGKDKYEITFAVNAACDATVAVLDKEGRVVRHLASGLLGPKAPAPFKRDLLAQTIEWDGKDDLGKPPTAKPLSVRVSLGLKPTFVRMLFEKPRGLRSRGPLGLAVDRNGLLYALEGDTYTGKHGLARALQKLNVKVFDREGGYVSTLVPFRGNWPTEKVSRVKFVTTLDGRRVPLALSGGNYSYGGYLPGAPGTVRNMPVITSDGRMFFICGKPVDKKRRMLMIGTDGSQRKDTFAGPPLQANANIAGQIFMGLSPDENFIYFAGARSKKPGGGSSLTHAVYRTTTTSPDHAKPFIGQEFKSGKEKGLFNDPRGLDVDPKGRIWVCDYMNDRVQVFDAGGNFLKMFDVPGPDQIRVHPRTGAVYVVSVKDRGKKKSSWGATWEIQSDKALVKFASFDDPKEVARLELVKRPNNMHDPGPQLVLLPETKENEPELWMWLAIPGSKAGPDFMWKVVDGKDGLKRVPHKMVCQTGRSGGTPCITADRRRNRLIVGGKELDPATGELRPLKLAGEPGKAALAGLHDVAVGPRGLLHFRSSITLEKLEKAWRIRRFDADGKLVPFKDGKEFLEANANRAITPWNSKPTSFDVGPDGKIYIVSAVSRKTRDVQVDMYNADGELVKPGLILMTKSGGCVRVDAAGRLYASDTVRPKDREIPDFYDSDPYGQFKRWYGTVLRYDPSGGGLTPVPGKAAATHLSGGMSEKLKPVQMRGMLWDYYGLSPMPLQTGCQCCTANVAFDADDWGRLWVPDAMGSCVAVLDCAGNVMTRFGAYGNRDATGAGGAVPEPPIPLWYPFDVSALDHDAFVRDQLAYRIVQVRLTYTAESQGTFSKFPDSSP